MSEKEIGYIDSDSMKRIGRAVKKIEALVPESKAAKHRTPHNAPGFWAKITMLESAGKKYSWKKLEAKDSNKLDENSDLDSIEYSAEAGYAIECNESKYVLIGSIVWLMPYTNKYFIFNYTPGVIQCKTGSSDSDVIASNGYKNVVVYKDGSATEIYVDVYNYFSVTIPKNTKIIAGYSQYNAKWYVIAQDCE